MSDLVKRLRIDAICSTESENVMHNMLEAADTLEETLEFLYAIRDANYKFELAPRVDAVQALIDKLEGARDE